MLVSMEVTGPMSESRGRPPKHGPMDFVGVRVPKTQTRVVDEVVEEGDWENQSEFVREAIREKLEVEQDV